MRYQEKLICVGDLQVNCVVLADTLNEILFVIDPGEDAGDIADAAEPYLGYKRKVILLTHAHVDHISAVGAVADLLNTSEIYLHPGDKSMYFSPDNHLLPYMPPANNLPNVQWPPAFKDLEVIACPGHRLGGAAYYFKEFGKAYVGDTIFRESVGRTDFPGGDYDTLIHTIREKILTLPDSVILVPGHGPTTTVGYERMHNPYLISHG